MTKVTIQKTSKLWKLVQLLGYSTALVVSAAAAQEYALPASDEDELELNALPDGERAFAKLLLTQQEYGELSYHSKVGDIGILHAYTVETVRQDDAKLFQQFKVWGITIDKVIDESNCIANNGRWWLDGWDTTPLYDGQLVTDGFVNQLAIVCDARTFQSTKVRCYKKVDCDKAKDVVSRLITKHGYRLWTHRDGSIQIAKFVRSTSDDVSLKLPTNQTIKMSIDLLSGADQDWVFEHR